VLAALAGTRPSGGGMMLAKARRAFCVTAATSTGLALEGGAAEDALDCGPLPPPPPAEEPVVHAEVLNSHDERQVSDPPE
jgi:hypothetical protein